MGIFAKLFLGDNTVIPEDKKEEFCKRVETIFREGGMMEIRCCELYGIRFLTMRKATMNEKGLSCYYNYYEDEGWENAGLDKKAARVWSRKIGGKHFNWAVVSAYVLQELYSDGVAVTCVDDQPVTEWQFVGWINYLFDEKYHVKNFDPWNLYETLNGYSEKEYGESFEGYLTFGDKRYAFIGDCEITAVRMGINTVLKNYKNQKLESLEKLAFEGMKDVISALKEYSRKSDLDADMQLKVLMDAIRTYYIMDDDIIDSFDDQLTNIIQALHTCDAPAFVVKGIAEIYGKDFWILWGEVKEVVKRRRTDIYGNDGNYVLPITTMDFFNQSPDDMIPYWHENCGFVFSSELMDWFGLLKRRYDVIIKSNIDVKNRMKHIVNLIAYAEDNYYQIYVFADFFEETKENISDNRYMTLWKIFEEMLNEEALKNARATLRRYMALVANKPLRNQVFGF